MTKGVDVSHIQNVKETAGSVWSDKGTNIEVILETALNSLCLEHKIRQLGEARLCMCELYSNGRFNILAFMDGTIRIWTHPVENMTYQTSQIVLAAAERVAEVTEAKFKVTDDEDLECEIWGQLPLSQTAGKQDVIGNMKKEANKWMTERIIEFAAILKQLEYELRHLNTKA